jgi:hypothetical protein
MVEPPNPELVPGRRVKVIRDPEWAGPWPSEPLGVIEPTPSDISVEGNDSGPIRRYQIRFDDPQLDAEGYGPFLGATVPEKYLVPLPPDPEG